MNDPVPTIGEAEPRVIRRGDRRIAAWMHPARVSEVSMMAVHGGPGFAHSYLTSAFAAGFGYPAVYFDWPGSGQSSRHPGSGYPLEEYVADLEAVRGATCGGRVVLLSHAWGAMPAVEYALHHPHRVAGLVLVNPIRILTAQGQDGEAMSRMVSLRDPSVGAAFMAEVAPLVERALAGDRGAWNEIDASPWWSRMWATQCAAAPPVQWIEQMRSNPWGLESYYAYKGRSMLNPDDPLASYDLAQRVQRLSAPLLIVASDSDANYVASLRVHAEPLKDALAGSVLEVIPDVGHFPFVEQPVTYRTIVGRFIERLVASSTVKA